MPALQLTCFDAPGRAEPIRVALFLAKLLAAEVVERREREVVRDRSREWDPGRNGGDDRARDRGDGRPRRRGGFFDVLGDIFD